MFSKPRNAENNRDALMFVTRFLEGNFYKKRKGEAAELQICAGEVPGAEDLLPVRWLFRGSSSIRQVELAQIS